MSHSPPRVLHVGFNPIGSATNTGLTLASMFGAWPEEDLLEVYTPSRQPRVPGRRALVAPPSVAPLDGAARWLLRSKIPAPLGDGLNNSVSRKGQRLGWRTRARITATTLNDVGPVRTNGRWIDAIEQFEPQVIHSLLGSVRITKVVAGLAERLDLPVVPHFMDDWPATMFADGRLRDLPRHQVTRSLQRVLDRSPVSLAIGTDMAREFQQRYDRDFEVVGNSVDFDLYERLARSASRAGGTPIVLRYVGGLHLGRAQAIGSLATVLDQMDYSDFQLVVHGPPSDHAVIEEMAGRHRSLVAGGTLSPGDVPDALVKSDVLLFIESDDPSILPFTRLSVSTKVPEYLAAQRPTLVLGPKDQASVRALLANGAARYGGSGDDGEVLREALRDVRSDAVAGTVAAGPAFRSLFDLKPTQDRLRSALERAAFA